MLGGESVFGGVTIRRTVTTKRGPACLTGAQVHPSCGNLDAFLAHSAVREFDLRNRLYM